jgi:hypothetical protein
VLPVCCCCCHQALELEAGLPASRSDGGAADALVMEQQAWTEFLEQFRDRLKLLRLVANVSAARSRLVLVGRLLLLVRLSGPAILNTL